MAIRTGGCNCGSVRLEIHGEPTRVGLCHCTVCRKETGGPYLAFAVFPEATVTVTGEIRNWADDLVHRHFCPTCGSRLFSLEGNGEVEVRLRVPRCRADRSGADVRELGRPSRKVAAAGAGKDGF